MFWQKEIELLRRDELRRLQTERLRKTVAAVWERVPFYRKRFGEAGVGPEAIGSIEDLCQLPFTTAEDVRRSYPEGLLAAPRSEVVRVHTSSGTTGNPKAIYFSRRDLETAADVMARCLTMTGATKEDVLQNMMTYGLFTGALMMHYGAERVGMLIVPSGPGHTERQVKLMRDFRTTILHLTPSYALYLADYLERQGIDPRKDLRIRIVYVGAEAYTEETRARIEAALGVDVFNCYGLSEMNGPGVAFECLEKSGLHLWEDQYLMEIVDPESGRPLPEGERGELVLTTLCREAMPLIRYRTRDITRILPEPCPCGRVHRRIERISGRADDMLIVRGVNFYPQQIEQVLMGVRGVGRNYQILLEQADELTVRVELSASAFDGRVEGLRALQETLERAIREEILVKPKIELVSPGSLPVSEGKAKRVIDNRTL